MKLDLGSRDGRYRDFLTVDLYAPSPDVRADVTALPFADGSIEEIWASHILEHLRPAQIQPALRGWLQVLKPGATGTIVVPDLDDACRAWLHRTPMAQSMIFGSCDVAGENHYIGWGALELRHELLTAGFQVLSVQSIRETATQHLGGSYWHNMASLVSVVRRPLVGHA